MEDKAEEWPGKAEIQLGIWTLVVVFIYQSVVPPLGMIAYVTADWA
jgi:hypothetical protein